MDLLFFAAEALNVSLYPSGSKWMGLICGGRVGRRIDYMYYNKWLRYNFCTQHDALSSAFTARFVINRGVGARSNSFENHTTLASPPKYNPTSSEPFVLHIAASASLMDPADSVYPRNPSVQQLAWFL